MIESIGIDIAEIVRFERLVGSYGDRFLKRILGPEELAIYAKRRDAAAFLAGRFAGKEAIVKALGKYLAVRPPLSSLQILYDNSARPVVKLPPEVEKQLGPVRILVSISHEKNYAAGMAVITEKA